MINSDAARLVAISRAATEASVEALRRSSRLLCLPAYPDDRAPRSADRPNRPEPK